MGAIAMIPQEPVLFGRTTLRYNLDPIGEHADAALEHALQEVRMDSKEVLPDGLLTELQEGGNSFSVGQRQLLSWPARCCGSRRSSSWTRRPPPSTMSRTRPS